MGKSWQPRLACLEVITTKKLGQSDCPKSSRTPPEELAAIGFVHLCKDWMIHDLFPRQGLIQVEKRQASLAPDSHFGFVQLFFNRRLTNS